MIGICTYFLHFPDHLLSNDQQCVGRNLFGLREDDLTMPWCQKLLRAFCLETLGGIPVTLSYMP